MDSQPEDKLIKKSAAIAGVSLVTAVISISAFSQWRPNSANLRMPLRYQSNIAQNPSEIKTTHSVTFNTSNTVPKSSSTTVFQRASTIPKTKLPSNSIPTSIAMTIPGSAVAPNKSSPLSSKTTSSSFIPPRNVSTTSEFPVSKIKPTRHSFYGTDSASSQDGRHLKLEVDDANATAVGLVVAKREGQIKPYSPMWRKAQDAIFLLRHGETRRQAARRAGIPKAMLMRLLKWGQNRPGTNGRMAKF